MKKVLLAFGLLFGMSACITIDYLGNTYPSSANVQIYFDAADIPEDYEVMGILAAEAPEIVGTPKIQERILNRAREVGADAVLFELFDRKYSGSITEVDEYRYGSSSNTFATEDKVVKARLLKFKF